MNDVFPMKPNEPEQSAPENVLARRGGQSLLAEPEDVSGQEGVNEQVEPPNSVFNSPDVWGSTENFLQAELIVEFTRDQVLNDAFLPSALCAPKHVSKRRALRTE